MRASRQPSLLLVAVASLAVGSPSAEHRGPRSPAPGVIQLDIARRNGLQGLTRRQTTDMASLLNNITNGAYVTTIKVGSPEQTLTLQVDTGSSDTWLPSTQAQICQTGGCFFGSYDQQQSTTASTIAQGAFSIRYADGTSAEGDYITDNFTIGGTTVSEFIMGLALSTGNQFGIMGIGLPSNEAVVQIDPGNAYPNLPVQMANLGLVSTTAYSLWLNDLDASTGSLLFGGVDTAKYHGPLSRLSLYPNPGSVNVTQFLVALTTVSATSPSGTDALGSQSFPVSAVLDSGTTFTLLPPDLVSAIWAEAGVVNKEEAGPLVPCSFSRASQGSFVFGFGGPGGPNITVPMDELVRTVPGSVGVFEDGVYKGQDACQFMITPMQSDQPVAILGDSFLRSAYVVYDLENLEVALAPTKFNATDSKVVAFDHRGAAVPDSAPAPHQDVESLQSVAIVTTNMSALTAQQGFLPANAAGRLASGKGIVAAVAVAAAMVLML